MRNMRKRAFSAIFAILLVWSIALPAAAAYVPDEISPHAHDVEYKSELVSSSSWIKYPVGFAGDSPKMVQYLPIPVAFFGLMAGIM